MSEDNLHSRIRRRNIGETAVNIFEELGNGINPPDTDTSHHVVLSIITKMPRQKDQVRVQPDGNP